MSRGGSEYKPLGNLEREINELSRLRLREARARVKITDADVAKFARSWAGKCAKPLREYCWRILTDLARQFTRESINALLREVIARGLSIEAIIILLSQCSLVQCDEAPIRNYLDTGKADLNQLMAILRGQGVAISPEDLRAVINGEYRANKDSKGSNALSWLPRFIRRSL